MRTANLCATALFVGLLVPMGSVFGQHSFTNTVTVDPSGNADQTSIQAAINSIGTVSVRHTVLIYAGEYNLTTPITLDADDENIDLVGIDRDSVIISVSGTDKSGIVITSGTETSRNNRIANLTIITSNGHGIEIVKPGGAQTPKDITIEGVTIHADGTGKIGVTGVLAENVTLSNCLVTSDDGDGMHVGDHWTLSQVTVETIEDTTFNQDALVVGDHTFLTVTDSTFIGERRCIWLDDAEDILVQNSQLTTSGAGGALVATLMITGVTKRVLFQNCLIVSDATLTAQARSTPRAVFVDDALATTIVEDIVLQSCRIIAVGDGSESGSTSVVAVINDIEGTPTLANCEVSAINKKTTTPAEAYGVWKQLRVLGGAISSSSAAENETEVWDVASTSVRLLTISGTRFSKYKGAPGSAERPRAVIQRTIDVSVADDDAIHAVVTLLASVQRITANITNPDVYRVLSVTGNENDMDQVVYIIGTDWAGNQITDGITLDGTATVDGVKPFKTVTAINFPIQKDPNETVKVGTTRKLGLYYPIASASDVLQQGKKSSGATSYTLESSPGTVDATYSTVEVSLLVGGVSFEWAILASQ